jgi:hypothetical protein
VRARVGYFAGVLLAAAGLGWVLGPAGAWSPPVLG